jgi:PIN domain nuclease of toxin-antitoxin system
LKLLLDTHAFLWFILSDAQLSAAGRAAISDPKNPVFVSPATYWEIAIKVSIGKYTLTVPFEDFIRHGIEDNDFEILPIEIRHAARVAALPFHHKDPFDRMLIAQALVDDLTLISNEALFDAYGVKRLW